MKKLDISGYTFNPSAKTITCGAFAQVGLGRIFLVNNATKGVVIYDPSSSATNGTLVGGTLTLTYDTTSHASTDTLSIFYDDAQLPVSSSNPMPVRLDQGSNGVNENLGGLQVENLDIEQASEQLATTLANTGSDEPMQLVGLHPNYPLPIDTSIPMPVAGKTFSGAQAQLQVNELGGVVLADGVTLQGQRSSLGSMLVFDTTGYSSLCIQITGTWVGTISFQCANDPSNWASCASWVVQGAGSSVTGTTNNGIWVSPTYAKFFRIAFTAYTSGNAVANVVMRSQQAFNTASTARIDISQVGGSAASPTSASVAFNALGPTAVGAAPTTSPVQSSGWDGTNVRRILTDTAGDTLIAGASAAGATTVTNPVQIAIGDLEGRVRRLQGDFYGRMRIVNEESGSKDDGVIDALNNVVRELKLLNARIADLPYFLGTNTVMPSDELAFRDDPTIFSI